MVSGGRTTSCSMSNDNPAAHRPRAAQPWSAQSPRVSAAQGSSRGISGVSVGHDVRIDGDLGGCEDLQRARIIPVWARRPRPLASAATRTSCLCGPPFPPTSASFICTKGPSGSGIVRAGLSYTVWWALHVSKVTLQPAGRRRAPGCPGRGQVARQEEGNGRAGNRVLDGLVAETEVQTS